MRMYLSQNIFWAEISVWFRGITTPYFEYHPHYSSSDTNNLINALECQEIITIAMCYEEKGHINVIVKGILIKNLNRLQ